MDTQFEIIDVNKSNVDKTGFFCYMSKRKEPGFKQKREWLDARFAEGMKIKILHEVDRRDTAFIEYIPGEYAWRAIHAPNYLVIHCLWVVGQGKGKGFGRQLIKTCLEDAQAQNKVGVAMVTTNEVWLAKKKIFLENGFKEVDQALGTFQLLTFDFGSSQDLRFATDWEERAKAFGSGLTILRTDQCPYNENATAAAITAANERGIESRVITFTTAKEVQERSPSPFGTFGAVLDGKLFTYHYFGDKEYAKLPQKFN